MASPESRSQTPDNPAALAAPHPIVRAWNWLDERYGLQDVVGFLRHKQVPVGSHSMVWYYLGGVTMFFFLIQIASGVLLLMYYQAGEATSYESMRFVVTKVPFGWLIRSIHCWSAHLMVLSLLAHMWSVFFLKAYRNPREMTWFSGMALFGIALGFGFSGYLLPWNELSFFATAVGTDSVKSVPVIGHWMLRVMRGGDEVSIRTLYRFYALHVCVLPMAAFGLIGLHLLLVQRQGMAAAMEPEGKPPTKPKPGMPFFPNFALRDLLLWLVALNLLALLAVLLPWGPGIPGMEWELGSKADALKPAYPGIKPEWYFLWMYQLLKEFPAHFLGFEGPQVCLFVSSILMGIWSSIPIFDRSASKNRPSPAFTDFGVAVLYFLVFLMLKAWDIGVKAPHGIDPNGDPAMAATIVRTATVATLALGLVITVVRRFVWKADYFWISVLPLLQAVLHGFFGVSYLNSAFICLALLAVVLIRTWRRTRLAAGAAAVLFLVLLPVSPAEAVERTEKTGVSAAPVPDEIAALATEKEAEAGGSLPENRWPQVFRQLFAASKSGKPYLDEKARQRFRDLPAHAQIRFFSAQKSGLLDSPEQLATLLSLDITQEHVELLVSDNCVLCHTNPNQQTDETLYRVRTDEHDPYRHLDIREVVNDVHLRKGLSCSGCHGGKPTDTEMPDEVHNRWPERDVRHKDRSWIPEFCTARCHAVPGFMRRFNPSLPIDQILKYRESVHGQRVIGMKDSKAAQCVSCHGVHGIRKPSSPLSLANPAIIPFTCGKCHADKRYMAGYTLPDGQTPIPTNQFELYRNSVHGKALFEKHDLGAPACNDCHGNHAAMPPDVASVSQICRNCHVNNGKLFDGSPHKAQFEKHGWPECETCHGKHDIQKPNDDMVGVGSKSVCVKCHEKFGKPICNETASYFHDQIGALVAARQRALAAVKHAEEQGHDLSDVKFQLQGVDDALIETRTKIHSFNKTEFDKAAKKGFELAATAEKTGVQVLEDYKLRRKGLFVVTFIVTFLGVVLYLKIKEIDRATGFDPGNDDDERG